MLSSCCSAPVGTRDAGSFRIFYCTNCGGEIGRVEII